MTALNAFGREDAAYLIADTGSYDLDGTVVSFGRKVGWCDNLRMMIGHSGQPGADCQSNIDHWVQTRRSQEEVFEQLADFLADLEADAEDGRWAAARIAERARKRGVPEDELPRQGPAGIRLALAWWDDALQRGRAATIASVANIGGNSETAYQLRRLQTLFSPALAFDRWPAHSFDPLADVGELGRLQRSLADGLCRVGGEFILYRVDRNGVTTGTFCEWPDVIGEPIKMTA